MKKKDKLKFVIKVLRTCKTMDQLFTWYEWAQKVVPGFSSSIGRYVWIEAHFRDQKAYVNRFST